MPKKPIPSVGRSGRISRDGFLRAFGDCKKKKKKKKEGRKKRIIRRRNDVYTHQKGQGVYVCVCVCVVIAHKQTKLLGGASQWTGGAHRRRTRFSVFIYPVHFFK